MNQTFLKIAVCTNVVVGFAVIHAQDLVRAPIARSVAPDAADQAVVQVKRRCGTVAPDRTQRAALRLRSLSFRTPNLDALKTTGPTQIKVFVHILTKGQTGAVSDQAVKKQIETLNEDYLSHGFQFELKSIDRTDVTDPAINKPAWFKMGVNTAAEREAKERLGVTPEKCLNLYTCLPTDTLMGTLLGFATFPWDLAGDPKRDGVVINYTSLPGGTAPFDKGKTATHEVGHWLGLFHTFQDGCNGDGDQVKDTGAQDDGDNIFKCDDSLDTCTMDNMKDPVHNFMNYADDACLVEFTDLQRDRMKVQTSMYRPLLFQPTLRATLRSFREAD